MTTAIVKFLCVFAYTNSNMFAKMRVQTSLNKNDLGFREQAFPGLFVGAPIADDFLTMPFCSVFFHSLMPHQPAFLDQQRSYF